MEFVTGEDSSVNELTVFLKKAGVVDVSSLSKEGKPNKVIRELLLGYHHQILYQGKIDQGWIEKNGFPDGKVFSSSRGFHIQFFLGPNPPSFSCPGCQLLIEKDGLIQTLKK